MTATPNTGPKFVAPVPDEMGMELGSCLADNCPNVDRRILVGERISEKAVEECCSLVGCIMTTPEGQED